MNKLENTFYSNGRVNLIGEHTDYNGGWVLPTAIPQQTSVRLRVRDDNQVVATTSADFSSAKSQLTYQLGDEKVTKTWLDYLQGGTQLLIKRGHKLRGFDIHIDSNVPTGSGLSSSAALEISFLKGLRHLFALNLTDVEIAQIGQKIENDFVGAQVGIMDQMACALAKFGEALFLDAKELSFERITLPFDLMDLVVINSGVEHQHAGGDYNQRRSECEEACKLLGIRELREISENDIEKILALPEILRRRARHVVTENARVHLAVQALKQKEIIKLGELFYASHASMKDDYEISISEIDLLVELCREQVGTFGARLTGGGFGGSIVAITEKNKGLAIASKVKELYLKKTGLTASILVP